jgi:hypothetical protein
LRDDLGRAGHDVWLDTEDIVGGEAWRRSIAAGIEGADVVLVLLSPDSVASPNVERELTIADESAKRVLPVVVSPTELPAGFRYALAGVQHVDFAREPYPAAVAQLLTAWGTPAAPRRAGRPGLSTVARRRLGLGVAALAGVIIALVVWQVIARRGDDGGTAEAGAFVGKDIVESFFDQPVDRVRSQITAQGAFTFPGDATACSNTVRRGAVARITRVDDDLRVVGDVLGVNGRAGREGNPLREPARLVITVSTGPCRG